MQKQTLPNLLDVCEVHQKIIDVTSPSHFFAMTWSPVTSVSLAEYRCWGVQHIGNIVANLYQGRDKNGSGSSVLNVMVMKKKYEYHRENGGGPLGWRAP